MKDARKVEGISLNKNSFEFVNHETSLSTEDFYEEDQQKVKVGQFQKVVFSISFKHVLGVFPLVMKTIARLHHE